MKIKMAILGLIASMFYAGAQEAESPWEFSASGTVLSSYLWAGYYYGGINIVPDVCLAYNLNDNWSVFAESICYIDTDIKILPNEDSYNYGTMLLGASYKGLDMYLDLEVYNYNFKSSHAYFWGAGFDWTVSEDFPLFLSVYTVLYNNAPIDIWGEVKEDGKQCHSTLITADMPFLEKGGFTLSADVAVVPWLSPFCGEYDKFSVCQLGLKGDWLIGKDEIPLGFIMGWNPALKCPYGQVSIGYNF